MANVKNLRMNSERTPKERKELARKAGIKSGEARQKKATFKKILDSMLYIEDAEGLTPAEKICMELVNSAINGNLKAFVLIRDSIGEAPTTKNEVTCKDSGSKTVYVTPEQQMATIKHIKAVLDGAE